MEITFILESPLTLLAGWDLVFLQTVAWTVVALVVISSFRTAAMASAE